MKMDECINLEERFGQRFKVVYEESYYTERTMNSLVDPWLMVIPCRYGHIFPHGGNTLAASVDGHTRIAGLLRCLPCCKVHQDGDGGELTSLMGFKPRLGVHCKCESTAQGCVPSPLADSQAVQA